MWPSFAQRWAQGLEVQVTDVVALEAQRGDAAVRGQRGANGGEGLGHQPRRRGVRSSRSASATLTPASARAWQTTCLRVMPRSRARAVIAAMLDSRSRMFNVVGLSWGSCAGGWLGAAAVAIATTASGEGRLVARAFSVFMPLRPYAHMPLRKDVVRRPEPTRAPAAPR